MIQEQKDQISHLNGSIELSEKDLHTILGAGCNGCGQTAFAAKAEAKHIEKQLPGIESQSAYEALAQKGYQYQKLAEKASENSKSFSGSIATDFDGRGQVRVVRESCQNCSYNKSKFNELKWGK